MILVHSNCPEQTNSEGRGQVPGDLPHIWYPKTQSQDRQYLMQLGLDYRNEVTKQMTTFYWDVQCAREAFSNGDYFERGARFQAEETSVMEDTQG